MAQSKEKQFLKYLEELNEFKFDFTLSRIKRVLKRLRNPQDTFSVIHIAGSNGKGSVACYLESVLRENNVRTGLYTSPHLKDVRERIIISGRPVAKNKFYTEGLRLRNRVKKSGIKLTYFEFLTVFAFVLFSKAGVDTAVVEAGLGGRYDATNVSYRSKLLSVITSVSKEHTNYLGKTVLAILKEKEQIAGKTPLLANVREKSLVNYLKRSKRNVYFADDFFTPAGAQHYTKGLVVILNDVLRGNEPVLETRMPELAQAENIKTVMAACSLLASQGTGLSWPAIRKGIKNAVLPGRLTLNKKGYYVSVAHNPAAIDSMLSSVEAMHGPEITCVFSVLKDKEVEDMVKVMAKRQGIKLILTQISNERAISIEKLVKIVVKYGIKHFVEKDNKKAMALANKLKGSGTVVVAGSFYLAGKYI